MDGQTERCAHCGAPSPTAAASAPTAAPQLGTEPTNPRIFAVGHRHRRAGLRRTGARVRRSPPRPPGPSPPPPGSQPATGPDAPRAEPPTSPRRPGAGPVDRRRGRDGRGAGARRLPPAPRPRRWRRHRTSPTPPIVPKTHPSPSSPTSSESSPHRTLVGSPVADGRPVRRPNVAGFAQASAPGPRPGGRRLRRPAGHLRRAQHGRRSQRHLLAHAGRRDRHGADLPARPADPAHPGRAGQRLRQDRRTPTAAPTTGTTATAASCPSTGSSTTARTRHPAARRRPRPCSRPRSTPVTTSDGPAPDHRRSRRRARAGPPATTPRSARCCCSAGTAPDRSEPRQHRGRRPRRPRRLTSRWVTIRTARRADRRDQHAVARARRPRTPRRRRAATTTMLVSTVVGVDAAGLGQQPGVRVVVGQPVDVVVEGVQPGGGQDADLAHPAAHPLAPDPRLGDRVGASPTTSEPTGAPSPLDRQTASTSAHGAVRRERDAGGDVGVPDPGAVEVDADADRGRPTRAAPARSSSGSTAPPAKLWVFSTETAVVRTKNGPMSGAYIASIAARSTWPRGSRQVRMVSPVRAPWAPSSARAMWADASHSTSCPACDQRRAPRARWPSSRSGVNSASSLPNSAATRSLRARGRSGPRRTRRRRPRPRPSPAASRRSGGSGCRSAGRWSRRHASGGARRSVEVVEPVPQRRPREAGVGADRDRLALLLVVDVDAVVEPADDPAGEQRAGRGRTGRRRRRPW